MKRLFFPLVLAKQAFNHDALVAHENYLQELSRDHEAIISEAGG